jgi:hypothetical protein
MSCSLCLRSEYRHKSYSKESRYANDSEQHDVLSPRHFERFVRDARSASSASLLCGKLSTSAMSASD